MAPDPTLNLRDKADALVGKLLGGRFRIERLLGQGSMGTVYEASQLPIGRRCAVKVLRDQLKDIKALRARFQREAQAISLLNHPNLVTLYDFGIEGDVPFIVMEFIEGVSLASLIPYEELSLEDTLRIFEQILTGVGEAHRQHIIHRDLKPENVSLIPDNRGFHHIKILDFGLAKLLERDDQIALTSSGEVYGTPLYMSPEQATGSHEVSAATDVYALGAMLYELLTGTPPFVGETAMAILSQHLRSPVPEIEPRPEIDPGPELLAITCRCLAKRPEQRYTDAMSLLRALLDSDGGRLLSGPRKQREPEGGATLSRRATSRISLMAVGAVPMPRRPSSAVLEPVSASQSAQAAPPARAPEARQQPPALQLAASREPQRSQSEALESLKRRLAQLDEQRPHQAATILGVQRAGLQVRPGDDPASMPSVQAATSRSASAAARPAPAPPRPRLPATPDPQAKAGAQASGGAEDVKPSMRASLVPSIQASAPTLSRSAEAASARGKRPSLVHAPVMPAINRRSARFLHPTAWVTLQPPGCLRRERGRGAAALDSDGG